ncbi:unnamed protein product, partial [marine sediment metagenome]
AKLIMKWRNDEITREMSFNQELKKWEEFKNEYYNNYFNNIPLFITLNGIKIAFVSYIKKTEEIYIIGINLDPNYREHYCDMLLDQNIYEINPYENLLLKKKSKILLGPKYVLLDPNYTKISPNKKISCLSKINICFGGSDPVNLTSKIIDIIKTINYINFDIIVGPYYQHYKELHEKTKEFLNIRLFKNPENMEKLLNESQLAIGSTGISSYERCYLGIPTIVITISENQINVAKNLEKKGVIDYLDHYDNFDENKLTILIEKYYNNEKLNKKREKCLKLIDGKG